MHMPSELDWAAFDKAAVTLLPGEKLVKSVNYHKYFPGECPYNTNFSFINIEGHIVAIGNGDGCVLGTGGFAHVKKAYLRDDASEWAVKIEGFNPSRVSSQQGKII